MKNNKHGQITVFIIIALVLILGIGGLIYLTQVKEEITIEEITYPQEVITVTNFIQQCIQQSARDAVVILGSQAGFIEIPPEIDFERAAYLRMDSAGLYKIPFWFFQGKSRIPPPDLMQFQISEYVEEHALECIDDFKAFEEQFTISPKEELKVTTLLTEENILLEATYPLVIETKGKTFSTDKYNTFLPVRLKKIYDLAVQIMKAENEKEFFENTTVDLMAGNPNIPMDGLDVGCVPKQWFLPTVKQELQNTLRSNLGRVRIKNTGYPPFESDDSTYRKLARASEDMWEEFVDGLEDYRQSKSLPDKTPSDAWDYFHLFYDVDAEPTDMRVSVEYSPAYGMDIVGNPNDNGILQSNIAEGASMLSGLFCVNQYHFVYDVKYPVKVIISDPKSFEGVGYNFIFAFPVMVNDNEGDRKGYSTDYFSEIGDPSGFCDAKGGELYEFRARNFYEGDLKDAAISYRCFNKFCDLGKTSAVRGVYRLVTPIPEGCFNPLVTAEKAGYIKDEKYATTQYTNFDLIKLRNLTLNVVSHDYQSTTQTLQATANDLIKTEIHDEQATILLKLKGDRRFNQYKAYEVDGENSIQLVDGDAEYELTVYYSLNNKIIGGYKNDNLKINYVDIQGDTITLHIFRFHPSTDEMGLTQYLMGGAYLDQLQPTFR